MSGLAILAMGTCDFVSVMATAWKDDLTMIEL